MFLSFSDIAHRLRSAARLAVQDRNVVGGAVGPSATCMAENRGFAGPQEFLHLFREEWSGFQAACSKGTNLVCVQISDAYDGLKPYRPGTIARYCTLEGVTDSKLLKIMLGRRVGIEPTTS